MTLLRRAPREVYRVYGEEEFLEGADHAEALQTLARAGQGGRAVLPPAVSGAGERRLRRVVGATLLVGAVGVVGALTAVSGLLSGRGTGRRFGGSLRASVGASVGPRVGLHGSRASHVSLARIWQARAAQRRRSELRPASQPARTKHGAAGERRRGPAGGARRSSLEIAVLAAQRPQAARVSVARLTAMAGAAASSQGPVRPEFGFER
jgi:hypothetical protein